MDWCLTYRDKNGRDIYTEIDQGKNILGDSELKLWTLHWGHGEHEWPLFNVLY